MHPQWQRLIVVLACLGVLAFFLARGGETPPEDPAPDGADDEVRILLPPLPDPKPLAEQARGLYVLEAADLRVSLELMADRSFRFLSRRGDQRRAAEGTWSLTGRKLSLAYTHMNGVPVGAEPLVIVNLWYGKTIELQDTGIPGRVVLTKRAMIRNR